ncbi:hypothetical protein PCANC_08106 [Puccinia coronata f. sp. avenae]|uniref:Uncharacterized protein n=1 Tax=Puccinia coronata f. sp. avenae TaxID=200324 RepID=A0A2N5V3H0_9BASI|nr:hypothetical protein PCANC_17543 [Puccinia coronata f. sp. avenae]PLW44531.1 hypothetical protein PCANC_08106 [Puccinia coronata f. sp. avenae]
MLFGSLQASTSWLAVTFKHRPNLGSDVPQFHLQTENLTVGMNGSGWGRVTREGHGQRDISDQSGSHWSHSVFAM